MKGRNNSLGGGVKLFMGGDKIPDNHNWEELKLQRGSAWVLKGGA